MEKAQSPRFGCILTGSKPTNCPPDCPYMEAECQDKELTCSFWKKVEYPYDYAFMG